MKYIELPPKYRHKLLQYRIKQYDNNLSEVYPLPDDISAFCMWQFTDEASPFWKKCRDASGYKELPETDELRLEYEIFIL